MSTRALISKLHKKTGQENGQAVKYDGQGRYAKEAAEKLAGLLRDGSDVIPEFDEKVAGTDPVFDTTVLSSFASANRGLQ